MVVGRLRPHEEIDARANLRALGFVGWLGLFERGVFDEQREDEATGLEATTVWIVTLLLRHWEH